MNTIQLDEVNNNNDSECSSERNIFDMVDENHENHEIQCLDFEMIENFEN